MAPILTLDPPKDIINLPNRLLEWETGTLRPHDPEVLSTIRVPVRWNPDATCPAIDRFLAEVLPEDCLDFVLEFIGYCLVPDNRLQRAVMLIGPGGNGKGTLLGVIRALLGSANVASRSLHMVTALSAARSAGLKLILRGDELWAEPAERVNPELRQRSWEAEKLSSASSGSKLTAETSWPRWLPGGSWSGSGPTAGRWSGPGSAWTRPIAPYWPPTGRPCWLRGSGRAGVGDGRGTAGTAHADARGAR
jgi:hypothetical protein